MQIIEPIEIDDTMLTASSVAENEYAAWDAGTAYATGGKVIYAHKIYEALDGTTGDQPDISPTKWLDLGATNRWKMFDDKVGTRTVATGGIVVEFLATKAVQSIALLECRALTAQVIIRDANSQEIYNKTKNFDITIPASNWWQYFFGETARRENIVFDDLPAFWGLVILVVISATPSADVECGTCILGHYHNFAKAVQLGARFGITDYSRKEKDDWGNIEIVERAYSKEASWGIVLDRVMVDKFFRVLSSLRARPAIYVGGTKEDVTFVYGFPKNWEIVIDYPKVAHCNVEIEGLT